MAKKVNVCCFCERWESGGIESFLFNVLTRIDLNELQVDLVTASLGKSIFTEPLQKLGIQFFELSGSQKNVLKNHRRFVSLLKERRWDVLHLNIFHGLSLSYLYLAEQEGVPIRIAHSHNTALRKSLTRPLKLVIHTWAKEQFTQYATDLWACSKDAAKFLFPKKALEQKGFRFIPNGIDIRRFRFDPAVRKGIRTDLGLEDKFVVGNVGRLCDQKNQGFLLEVFTELVRRCQESRLLLVGEGEDRMQLEERAKKLGISDKVLFYGVSRHVERLMWAMDVFAFPSRFEGLGIAAIEAQAAGLPILCSEHIPQEALMTDRVTQLSLSIGAKVWAEAVLNTNASPDRSAAVREVSAAGYDVKAVAEKIRGTWMG